jgi:hypothetical protein
VAIHRFQAHPCHAGGWHVHDQQRQRWTVEAWPREHAQEIAGELNGRSEEAAGYRWGPMVPPFSGEAA